jgi:hypothetical protein
MTFIETHLRCGADFVFGTPDALALYDGKQWNGVQSPMMSGQGDLKSGDVAVKRRIREAGERARSEAEARRQAEAEASANAKPAPKEINGRDGPDPVRHGDWEVKGIASDF